MDKSGDGFSVKLIDFGLARSLLPNSSQPVPASTASPASPGSSLQRTATGAAGEGEAKFTSTRSYTAPELSHWRQEFGQYGEKADSYSLACTLIWAFNRSLVETIDHTGIIYPDAAVIKAREVFDCPSASSGEVCKCGGRCLQDFVVQLAQVN